MGPNLAYGLAAAFLTLITACSPTLDRQAEEGPRFRLTVEEAGFVAKGELFRIYGEDADPVIVEVTATEIDLDGQPGWRLDTLVNVLINNRTEQRRWRFWVALDPEGFPAVLQRTDTST